MTISIHRSLNSSVKIAGIPIMYLIVGLFLKSVLLIKKPSFLLVLLLIETGYWVLLRRYQLKIYEGGKLFQYVIQRGLWLRLKDHNEKHIN